MSAAERALAALARAGFELDQLKSLVKKEWLAPTEVRFPVVPKRRSIDPMALLESRAGDPIQGEALLVIAQHLEVCGCTEVDTGIQEMEGCQYCIHIYATFGGKRLAWSKMTSFALGLGHALYGLESDIRESAQRYVFGGATFWEAFRVREPGETFGGIGS